jgi:hypothetical protein
MTLKMTEKLVAEVAAYSVIFVGAQYMALSLMFAIGQRWGMSLTFFAYALANVGLYIEAR